MGVQFCTQKTRRPIKKYPLVSRKLRVSEMLDIDVSVWDDWWKSAKHCIRLVAQRLKANPGGSGDSQHLLLGKHQRMVSNSP